jgi:deoxycytidylate deaminase
MAPVLPFSSKYGKMTFPTTDLSKRQRSYLDLAARAAESSEAEQRHGAVVVKGGRVMSLGVNKWRNRDMIKTAGSGYNEHLTVHAEIDALARVSNPKGAVIYIARISKSGQEKLSMPCERCAEALMVAGIKQIIYTVG